MIVQEYHFISGKGTFDDPYWCTVTGQYARKCVTCVARIPELRPRIVNDPINYPSYYTDG
jgi:hypothetical protein